MHDPIYPSYPPVPAHRAASRSRRWAFPSFVTLLAVAVLSAALASLSTFGLVTALGGGTIVSVTPVGVPTGAAQAAPVVSTSAADDFASVVARATDSVVTITAEGLSAGDLSPFSLPATGVGSGIVVGSDGLILTNNHVVEGAHTLTVTTSSGQDLEATVVDTDLEHDIAIIRAKGGDLSPATLGDSDQLQVGQTVLAIGSPLGEFTETVTRGIVSALDRSITVADETSGNKKDLSGLIQTDAAINPGNSGGPLIDESGRVVGMNTAVSRSAEGLGFAIPINSAKDIIAKAVANGA